MPFRITPAVLNILIINVLVFISLHLIQHDWFMELFLLFKTDLIFDRYYFGMDLSEHFQPIQIVTSFFAHIDVFHIFFNMYALVMFGTMLEAVIGSRRFIQEYLIFGVASGILIALFDPSDMPVLGASTALSGLLVSFAMLYPNTEIGIMFLPIQFKAYHYVIGLAVISGGLVLYGLVTGKDTGSISHFGHFAGMAVAFIYHQFSRFLYQRRKR